MAVSFLITSSITSKLAFAIICITCRSCPPRGTPPPAPGLYAGDVAPDKAFRVPAKAVADQDGRFEAKGYAVDGAGFEDWCVNE